MYQFKVQFLVAFLLTCQVFSTYGQDIDNRKTESDIKIEDRFVQAKFLVIAGKTDDAIKQLDTIRRAVPEDAAVYFELAKLYRSKKDINQTETNVQKAVKLAPDNVALREYEVSFMEELGKFDQAVESLTYLSQLSPKKSDYYDRIVRIYINNRELDKALAVLDKKEMNIGFNVNTTLKKAEILDNSGDVLGAVNILTELTERFPNDPKYLKLIASMLMSNDMVSQAIPYYSKVLDIDQSDTDAKMAIMIHSQKELTEDDFLIALRPMITNAEVPFDIKIKELLPLVQKHALSEDTLLGTELISLCDALVLGHPNEAKAHAIYGDVLMNNGDMIAAIRQYEKTLSLYKNNYLVWEQLMSALQKTDNPTSLLKWSLDAIDYYPNQAMSYYYAGDAYYKLKENKKATSMLDEAIVISAENPNIMSRVLCTQAQMAMDMPETKKAMVIIDQALEWSESKNTDALEVKGDIYKTNGDLVNARKYWQKALDGGSQSPKLMIKLSQAISK